MRLRLDNDSVLAARAIVLWITRAAGFVLVTTGFVGVTHRVIYGITFAGDLTAAWNVLDPTTGMAGALYTGIPLMISGSVFLVFGRLIARFVVTPPETGCARCGYETAPPMPLQFLSPRNTEFS